MSLTLKFVPTGLILQLNFVIKKYMSLFYSSWNCVEVFGWSTDCWVDSWRTSKCFKEYPRRCFCSETCQGKISIYLFIYLFIRLISQENGNVSWRWCAQILLNNWLDQWQSCKLGTGSHVQSFPCPFPSSTDVSVLLLNQPIACDKRSPLF